ncbi:hypothetical protein MMC25_006803 [Agyrium rufum]|nr:hypothetical protein [Agyrium rufum]
MESVGSTTRMPSLENLDSTNNASRANEMKHEVNTTSLVQQKTSIPVPQIYAFEADCDGHVKAPFMLMECLEGNVGMNLSMDLPSNYKKAFVSKSSYLRYICPKSGHQFRSTRTVQSIRARYPGLRGHFDTATEFFKPWAANVECGMPGELLQQACGSFADEIIPSIDLFKKSIYELADRLSCHDSGPFPLGYGDFGHNNVIVDEQWNILGVIDWEMAFAGPWEVFEDFPLTISSTPRAMDAPWNWNEDGTPKSSISAEKLADQDFYLDIVKHEEEKEEIKYLSLSAVWSDPRKQQVMTAMRLYEGGKAGFYSKVIDEFRSDHSGI